MYSITASVWKEISLLTRHCLHRTSYLVVYSGGFFHHFHVLHASRCNTQQQLTWESKQGKDATAVVLPAKTETLIET
jgi:hypothetical protein